MLMEHIEAARKCGYDEGYAAGLARAEKVVEAVRRAVEDLPCKFYVMCLPNDTAPCNLCRTKRALRSALAAYEGGAK